MLPLTTKPTRVTEKCATLIDHIWTSNTRNNIENCIVYTDVTDNFRIYSQFKKYNV